MAIEDGGALRTDSVIHIQHVDATGSSAGFNGSGEIWRANAISEIALAAGGQGNAAVAYAFNPSGSGSPTMVSSRHISPFGSSINYGGDVPVTSVVGAVASPRIASGPSGRIFVSWRDFATGSVKAQALDYYGNLLWGVAGLVVGAAADNGRHKPPDMMVAHGHRFLPGYHG